jgi:hypothetical protein
MSEFPKALDRYEAIRKDAGDGKNVTASVLPFRPT